MHEKIQSIAENVRAQHELYLNALTGALSRTIEGAVDPTSARARAAYEGEVKRAARSYKAGVERDLKDACVAVVTNAIMDSTIVMSGEEERMVFEYATSVKEELQTMIGLCIERDAATATGQLRHFALRVSLEGNGVGKTTAIIGARHETINSLRFMQRDTLGRRYGSAAFVNTLIKSYLLNLYIETKVYAFAMGDIDLVTVTTTGETLSITGKTSGYPTVFDAMDRVFHPNSVADVTPLFQ